MVLKGSKKSVLWLLMAMLLLEEVLFQSPLVQFPGGMFMVDSYDYDWQHFCSSILPGLMLVPMAAVVDLRLGRQNVLGWGLGFWAAGLFCTWFMPPLANYVMVVGHVLFLPAAFLTLVSELSVVRGRRDAAFLLAWALVWLGNIGGVIFEPFWDALLVLGMVAALGIGGFLLWYWRKHLRVDGPPVMAQSKEKGPYVLFQAGQVAVGALLGWGLMMVMEGLLGYASYQMELFLALVTGVVVAVMLRLAKVGRLWLGLGIALCFSVFLLRASFNGLHPLSDWYGYAGIGLEEFSTIFWPCLAGVVLVAAGSWWLPERLPARAGSLLRVLAGILLLGLLSLTRSLPWQLEFGLLGVASALAFPAVYHLLWEAAPSRFKTMAVALGLLFSQFAGQFLYLVSRLTLDLDAPSVLMMVLYEALLPYLLPGTLLLAGLMLVIWLRKRQA